MNRTIQRLFAFFVLLFGLLVLRQFYVQVWQGPSYAAKPHNPRHQLLAQHRGRILASDGTVLAQTAGETRQYPLGASLAQTVGYASQRYGTSGIEDAYDEALTPPDTTGQPDAQLAQIIEAFSGRAVVPHGADIITTINPAIQAQLFSLLDEHARGAGVVLDPRSGAVLAIASVPSYDPNGFDAAFPSLSHDTTSPLLNRAKDGLYPPGSTFKIVTASAALDSGTFTPSSTFEDPGYYTVGDFTLHDDEGEVPGTLDMTGAFAHSSNVDFAQIALKLGTDKFYDYLGRFAIGDSLQFQLPAARDRVPPKADVVPGELAQMGFGQGALLVTPLRMALVASAIANGGVEPRPYIVRQVVHPLGISSSMGAAALAQPVSADTAGDVKKMMVAVVEQGTGTVAQLPGVTVAGKTGTATNPFGRAHSWFVCFAPAENPRVAVAVIVENAGYGAEVAAPIAREVLRTALQSVRS